MNKMFHSDTEILLSDDIDTPFKKTKLKKFHKRQKKTKLKKTEKTCYFLLCIDWDMTIIDKNNIPFPSVVWFLSKLSTLWSNIYLVVNTLANEEHIKYTMPKFFESKYDDIVYNIPTKPLNVVRRHVSDMKYLNGFTALLDDNSANYSGQYDIFIDVSMYYIKDNRQKIIDVDYKEIYNVLKKKIEEFLTTKK